MVEKLKKTKKKLRSPSAFAGLFVVIALMAALTWIIPSGQYQTQPDPNNSDKTVRISGTYEQIAKVETTTVDGESTTTDVRQGAWDVIMAPIQGMAEKLDVVVFVMILGGFLGVVMKTGALDSMLGSLLNKMQGREIWLIPILMLLFAIGGTTYGMQEESVAFYALVVPIMLAAGYNAMTAVMVIVLGAGVGVLGSTINPFSTGIAARTADMALSDVFVIQGIVLVLGLIAAIAFTMRYAKQVKAGKYKSDDRTKPTVATTLDMNNIPKFTGARKSVMIVFALTFVFMILSLIPWEDFGVTMFVNLYDWAVGLPVIGALVGVGHGLPFGEWYFNEISALFLLSTFIIAAIYYKQFHKDNVMIIDTFIKGVADLLPVALIIAVATAVSVVMSNGAIQDTVIHWGEEALAGAGSISFVLLVFLIYLPLTILIPSSSGLATLSIPIMAPLGKFAGVGGDLVVTAFQSASGLVNIITPTAAVVMGALALGHVPYDRWVKYVWKLMLYFLVLTLVFLIVGVALG